MCSEGNHIAEPILFNNLYIFLKEEKKCLPVEF